ncbi:MAG TPA: hypothetical protein VJ731_01290 [Terriglobales bacterium]|nr:hypothetical protein [Terriglobales bacterium]
MTAVLCSVLVSNSTWAQNNDNHWDEYQPRTLASIIRMHDQDIHDLDLQSEKKAMLLTGDNFPSRTVLVYTGKSRPLLADKQKLLSAWRLMLKSEAPPEDEFKTEVLFREGKKPHWVAVQNVLLQDLPREVKPGQAVTGYIVWIGAIRTRKDWRWLFALNDFAAN